MSFISVFVVFVSVWAGAWVVLILFVMLIDLTSFGVEFTVVDTFFILIFGLTISVTLSAVVVVACDMSAVGFLFGSVNLGIPINMAFVAAGVS